MNPVIKNSAVAVLYTPSTGYGWSTVNSRYPQMLFDPKVVEYVELDQLDNIDELLHGYLEPTYPDADFSGLKYLEITWIPTDSLIRVESIYSPAHGDYYEHVRVFDQRYWIQV